MLSHISVKHILQWCSWFAAWGLYILLLPKDLETTKCILTSFLCHVLSYCLCIECKRDFSYTKDPSKGPKVLRQHCWNPASRQNLSCCQRKPSRFLIPSSLIICSRIIPSTAWLGRRSGQYFLVPQFCIGLLLGWLPGWSEKQLGVGSCAGLVVFGGSHSSQLWPAQPSKQPPLGQGNDSSEGSAQTCCVVYDIRHLSCKSFLNLYCLQLQGWF